MYKINLIMNYALAGGGLADVLRGEIYQKLLSYANPIAILSMVGCGFIWLTSTSTQSAEKAKSWLFRILIGLIVINGAPQFVQWISETIGTVGL